MMDENDRLDANIHANLDQYWAWMKTRKEHIERIANEGPNDTDLDKLLCRIMAKQTIAEILLREVEMLDYEEGE